MDNKTPAIVCDAELLSQLNIIQCLGNKRIPVIAISSSKNAIGFHSRYIKEAIISPMVTHNPSFIDFLIGNIERGVLFYGSDANAELFSKYKTILQESGYYLRISEPSSHEGVYDKYLLYKNSLKAGVSVPKSVLVENSDIKSFVWEGLKFPFLLKPTKGAGGNYAVVKEKGQCLQDVYDRLSNELSDKKYRHNNSKIIVQEYAHIDHPELWNYNALYNKGIGIAEFTGLRIRTPQNQDGFLASALLYGRSFSNRELCRLNRKLLSYMNFDGMVETEWAFDPAKKKYILFDVNPRPSGNIKWSIKGNVNIPYLYYQLCINDLEEKLCVQKEGVTYHKIFWPVVDYLDGLSGAEKKLIDKFGVVLSNIIALLTPWKNRALDVFDIKDFKPTWIMIKVVASRLKAFVRKRIQI